MLRNRSALLTPVASEKEITVITSTVQRSWHTYIYVYVAYIYIHIYPIYVTHGINIYQYGIVHVYISKKAFTLVEKMRTLLDI